MFKANLKIAWRNIIKDKQFTLLNVLGLSAGIACALLIFLWVNDEMSFDKFFTNNDRLYEVMEHRTGNGQTSISDESSGMVSKTLVLQVPEIEYASPLAPPFWFQKYLLSVGDKNIKASGQYAGKDYFNIFSFKLIDGKKNDVLKDKNSIVISDELANKLFGTTQNLIGKAIRFQQDTTFFVSGVFEKTPYHSSQQFDFVLSFDYLGDVQSWVKTWNNLGPHNYVLLKEGASVDAVNRKIAGFIRANSQDTSRSIFLSKFSNIYLQDSFDHGQQTGGKIAYVRLFSLIAIFILIIACINFMNLSTAKASRRMKEIGIKKVVGAERKQLIFQFLSESMLLTLFATVFAIVITLLLLPPFNQITGKEISLHFNPSIIISLIGIILFTGLLAGSYPALYLSKFTPLAILKGKLNTSVAEVVSRKGLVIFQFTLSSILIIAVLIVYQQIQFIQNTSPGYHKENIVKIDSEGKIQGTEETFIAELKKIPGVVNASFTFNNMVGRNFGNSGISWDGKDPNSDVYFEGFGIGYDFIETMGMKMQDGRSFSKSYGADSLKIILNEAAINVMHLKDPVGKTIRLFDNPLQIIGVVKDFHFESLHTVVKPSYMVLQREGANPWFKIMTRIRSDNQQQTLAAIQHFYETYNPGFPFTFNFLDEAYKKQYDSEVRVSVLSKYFAGLAIIISCLGLFGLAAFTAQKRRKEIGIRKVIGASVSNITAMLSKDFLMLVSISLIIACPVSWWLMNSWLQGFAYRINIRPFVFFITGISVIVMTLITISFQSIKAAMANPVKSLRTE
jgi:putative ABC transport system permease protein